MSDPRTFEFAIDDAGQIEAGRGVLAAYVPQAPGERPVILFAADPRREPPRPVDDLAPFVIAYLTQELGPLEGEPLWARVDNYGRFHHIVRTANGALSFDKFEHGINVESFFKAAGATGEAAVEVLSAILEVPQQTEALPDEYEFLGVIEAHNNLPAPGLVFKKVEVAAQDGDARAVAAAVQTDPVISATLINAANAARFAAAGKTASVPQAVVRLGTAFVRRIVFVAAMMSRYRKGACAVFDYRAYWMNAIANGAAMRALGEEFDINPRYADDLFMTGLVSGIGWLAMAETYPDLMAQYVERCRGADPLTKTRAYREFFPCEMRKVSARYLERYDFPTTLREAITGQTNEYRNWYECLAKAVRIGNALSPLECNPLPTTLLVPPECTTEWAQWRTLLD
jgi:HD-like signal output (HDOD) protein